MFVRVFLPSKLVAMVGASFTRWVAIALAAAIALFPAALSTQTAYPYHRCAKNADPQDTYDLDMSVMFVGTLPWGVVYYNESVAFVAVNFSIAILDTSNFTPKLVSTILIGPDATMANDHSDDDGYGFRELRLSHDKENLYVATGYGALILDVPRALAGMADQILSCTCHANELTGSDDAVVGRLSSDGEIGQSSIDLSIAPGDKYVFVSQEFGSNKTYKRGAIEVFEVERQDNRTVTSTWKGFIILGYATISQEYSADGTKLFVTSELNKTSLAQNTSTGIVSILDVAKLKTTPGKALIGNITAGCRPVRCQLSSDKTKLWVTQRDSNMLSVFDAEMLANNITTPDALLATVATGTSPVGLTIVGDTIFTADTNRFNYSNATVGLTVVNSGQAIDDGITAFPQLQTYAYAWPRTLVVSPDGNTLLASEYGTATIRAVNVTALNIS